MSELNSIEKEFAYNKAKNYILGQYRYYIILQPDYYDPIYKNTLLECYNKLTLENATDVYNQLVNFNNTASLESLAKIKTVCFKLSGNLIAISLIGLSIKKMSEMYLQKYPDSKLSWFLSKFYTGSKYISYGSGIVGLVIGFFGLIMH